MTVTTTLETKGLRMRDRFIIPDFATVPTTKRRDILWKARRLSYARLVVRFRNYLHEK